jgi:homoserine O-succinyltransferase
MAIGTQIVDFVQPSWLAAHPCDVLHIGLVNNMADGALEQTERQFFQLVGGAGAAFRIRWHLFSLRSIARGEAARLHLMHENYHELREIYATKLDGLIVTGTEPGQQDLRQETYWPELSELLDWIGEEGPPAIFSCLAAHAAVLRYDGIERRRLAYKRCGTFDHIVANRHPLTNELTGTLTVPHSRWNEAPPDALEEAGYQILTYAPEAGADLFVKQRRNLLMFFQGHPEYDHNTLAREYRRDVRRYLTRVTDSYPALPQYYFAQDGALALDLFRKRALETRNEALLAEFPAIAADNRNPGTSALQPAVSMWLCLLKELAEKRHGAAPARIAKTSWQL